ncbi:MAG: FadR family transcriptional regulator [Candidatus Marinimicrobia bacterium]|nr:FadR family transcriptional regulator [Candidatus Neomarinimicrobiota bacterium]
MLKSLDQKPLVDIVEEKLCEYLSSGKYYTGDQLPKEQEIAEQLKVSRNIVREALSRLRMLGLIESRKKKGMVLSEPQLFNGFERIAHARFFSDKKIKELLEFRYVLEMGLPELLYRNQENIDFERLEDLAGQYEKATTSKERIQFDREFHATLYKATNNETIIRFVTILTPVLEFQAKTENSESAIPLSHAELVKILKSGTKNQFRNAMEKHLKNKIEQLKDF